MEERIRNRAYQILQERAATGRGAVTAGPSFYQGAGAVTAGPSFYQGAGAVTAGPSYYQGAGAVTAGPSYYQGAGMVGGANNTWFDKGMRGVLGVVKDVVPFATPIASLFGGKKKPKAKTVKAKPAKSRKAIKETAKGDGLMDEIGKATRLLGLIGLGKEKKKPKRQPTARGALISKIMKNLAQASKYIKENNIKY